MSAAEAAAVLGSIEEAAELIGAVNLPAGAIIATLGLFGYGAYRIKKLVDHVRGKNYNTKTINKIIKEADPNQHKVNLDLLKEWNKQFNEKPEIDIVPQENQHSDSDIIPLSEQHSQSDKTGYTLAENFKEAALTVPGHPHTGLQKNYGKPSNDVDSDSIPHDQAYDDAKTFGDVQKADEDLIKKSGDHVIETLRKPGNTDYIPAAGAAIQNVVINLKHHIEKKFGHSLYPKLSGKLWQQHQNNIDQTKNLLIN